MVFMNFQGYSQKYNGTIIRVIDGDTYVFLTKTGSFTVRMLGIDAPERDQPFSRESEFSYIYCLDIYKFADPVHRKFPAIA